VAQVRRRDDRPRPRGGDVLGQGDRGGLVGRAIVDPGQQVRV